MVPIPVFAWFSASEWLGSWHAVLLFGLASLVVAEAILARTRWSESRPLAVCVGLSVVAHVVLVVYAYGARVQGPGAGAAGFGSGETIVSFNLVGDDEGDDITPGESTGVTDAAPDSEKPSEVEPDDGAKPEPPDLLEAPQANPLPDQVAESTPPSDPPAPQLADSGMPEPPNSPPVVPVPNTLPSVPDVPPTAPAARVPVAAIAAAAALPRVYQNRRSDHRAAVLQFGGSADTEAAVKLALDWLVANQAADGRWDADAHGAGREARILGQDRGGAGANADTGITGLAVLALMASGDTHLEGERRESIQHGLEFLVASQAADGNLAGNAELFARMYCHGIASFALSEAYAMTRDERLKPFVDRAIGYTIATQHRQTGGWRYQPGDTGDLSQFGWQLLALKSAELAGFEIPAATRAGMERFLDSVTAGRDRGLACYRPREQPTRTMTAEGLLCRFFLNRFSDAQIAEASAFILEEPPGRGQVNFYYWYYATLALHQAQGPAWKTWNERLSARLLASQRLQGPQAGSWDPDPVWGNYGGRVFSTALGALCLETYYRYLPLAERLAPGGVQR